MFFLYVISFWAIYTARNKRNHIECNAKQKVCDGDVCSVEIRDSSNCAGKKNHPQFTKNRAIFFVSGHHRYIDDEIF